MLSLVGTPALSPAAAAVAAAAVEAVAAVMLVELGSAVFVLHHWLPTNMKQDICLFGFLGSTDNTFEDNLKTGNPTVDLHSSPTTCGFTWNTQIVS